MSDARDKELDRRIAALGRLGRTKSGRKIIKDHGRAIASLMVERLPE